MGPDVKRKILEEIEKFLDGRLTGKLKPKAMSMEVKSCGPMDGEKPMRSLAREVGEEEKYPAQDSALSEGAIEAQGGDLNLLSPDELDTLYVLYDKMGIGRPGFEDVSNDEDKAKYQDLMGKMGVA